MPGQPGEEVADHPGAIRPGPDGRLRDQGRTPGATRIPAQRRDKPLGHRRAGEQIDPAARMSSSRRSGCGPSGPRSPRSGACDAVDPVARPGAVHATRQLQLPGDVTHSH
jgi:hypothetical protein